jgi:hypothetical protein
MPPFRWEDVDRSLVSLKLTELAIEMHERIGADESRIEFEDRKNLNSNKAPLLVLEMKVERAPECSN